MSQGQFFDRAPYQAHSPTSKDAAGQIAPNLGRLQAEVLRTLRVHGAMTDNELIAFLALSPSTIRPRRIELVKLGLVRQGGEKVAANGRRSALWEAIT